MPTSLGCAADGTVEDFQMTARQMIRLIPGAVPTIRAARWMLSVPLPSNSPPVVPFIPTYNEDHLATDHWLTTTEKFDRAYDRALSLGLDGGNRLKWRAHVTSWAASIGSKLDGAFVECGVNRGFHSRIICDYLDTVPNFYLLDTYKGFDERTLSQAEAANIKAWFAANGKTGDWRQGQYRECYDDTVATFADKPQVKVIRGTVPDTLTQVTEDKIAYLSLDMNCAMPEIAAMEYFWPKMVSGCITVLDDYGWEGHENQRAQFDAFAARNGVPLLSMPTGQGIIIKP